MSTPFDVRRWAEQAGIQTTGGFAVVAECVTVDELQRFADIAIAAAAKHWQRAHAIAALAEPTVPSDCADSHQPVAWLFTNLQSGDYDFCYCEDEHDHDREMWHKQPLYTTLPQRKPLTYGEISKILSRYETNYDMIGFARAIEKAHGI